MREERLGEEYEGVFAPSKWKSLFLGLGLFIAHEGEIVDHETV